MNKKSFYQVLIIVLTLDILTLLFKNNVNILLFLSAFQIFYSIYVITKKLNYNIFCFANIFLLLSYLFHVGQYFLIVFNIKADIAFNITKLSTANEYSQALCYYVYCLGSLLIGIAFCHKYNVKKKLKEKNIFATSKEKYKIILIILILLGAVTKFYIDFSKLFLYINGNYLSTYNFKIFGFFYIISHFYEYGIMMLLLYLKENKRKASLVFLIGIISEIPIILSGNRGWAIVFILIYSLIYFSEIVKISIKKIKPLKVIIALILFSLLLSSINFVSDIRSIESKNMFDLFNIYKRYVFNFPVFDIMGEFGGTIISTIYSMRFIPSYNNYGYGMTYILGVLNVLPNIGGFLNNFRNSMSFVYSFPKDFYSSLGGSYIGELYYNFGYFGIIFSSGIGFILGYLIKNMKKSFENKYSLLTVACFCVCANMLWWIRDYFSGIIREILWFSVFLFVLNFVVSFFVERGKKSA